MDTKSKAYEEMCQQVADWSDRHGFSLGATAELGNLLEKFHLTQCQEVDRLKELLCVAQDYLEQHWDMRSVPLREIDDIANKHLAEAALKEQQ